MTGQPGVGSAKDYVGVLRRSSEYAEITSGSPQLDDVAVWTNYKGRMGSLHGHIGHIAFLPDGTPVVIGILAGKPGFAQLTGGNTKPHIFRLRK